MFKRILDDLGASVLVKLTTFPATAILGVLALHSIASSYQAEGVAVYGLMIAIPLMVPFADLGIGGSIVELIAARQAYGREQVDRGIRKALAVLFASSALVCSVALALGFSGTWRDVLGLDGQTVNLAATTTFVTFGLCIPLSIGYRILLGFGQNWIVVALQATAGALGAGLTIVCASKTLPLWIVVSIPQCAVLLFSLAACVIARRRLIGTEDQHETVGVGGVTGRPAIQAGPVFRLRHMATSNLAIGVSLPIAFQAGRLVLAHEAGADAVAAYTAAFALYNPLNSLLITAGQSLWPRFSETAHSRRSDLPRAVARAVRWMSLSALIAGVLLTVMGPYVALRIVDSAVTIPPYLFAAFALLLVANSINMPMGMALMNQANVKFLALCSGSMAAVSLVLCYFLAPVLAATGVVAATLLAQTIFVTAPSAWRLFAPASSNNAPKKVTV